MHAVNADDLRIAWWGFNLIDLAPIAFMFILGFIIYPTFQGKYERTGKRAFHDHLVKGLALNGVFLLGTFIADRIMAADNPDHVASGWSFMNDVATTAIFMTPFLTKPFRESTVLKFVAGAVLLTLYGLFRAQINPLLSPAHPTMGGGIGACIGFAGVALFSAGMGDLMRKREWHWLIGVAVFYIVGIICSQVLMPLETMPEPYYYYGLMRYPIHFAAFSSLYMVSALSKVLVAYTGLWAICRYLLKGKAIWGLSTIGRNLMLYILILFVGIAGMSILPKGLGLSILYAAIMMALCFVIAIPLEKKKMTFKL
jgi:hypothetical protein